jgi:hypothetical protein
MVIWKFKAHECIKAVKIKLSLATTVQDIYYILIITTTCFGLFKGHPQAILTILNIKIKVTIPTTDPSCIAKSNCIYYRQRLPLSIVSCKFSNLSVKMVIKSLKLK